MGSTLIAPDNIFLSVDSSVVHYDGSSWTDGNNIVFANQFTFTPWEYGSIAYDSKNNLIAFSRPGTFIEYYRNDTMWTKIMRHSSQGYRKAAVPHNIVFYKGNFYFVNGNFMLSKIIEEDSVKIYLDTAYIDKSMKRYPNISIIPGLRVYKDKLWFSTNDGTVNSFDGENFEKLYPMQNISAPLEDYYEIRDINFDRDENLWLTVLWVKNHIHGTINSHTIIKFNKKDNFTTYEMFHRQNADNTLRSYFDVFRTELDATDETNRKVYIQSYTGFMVYDPDATSVQSYADESVSVFPNPARESISITGGELSSATKFEIIDVRGQKIIEGKLLNNKINVNTLEKGMYILRLSDTNQSRSFKFVKE